MCCSKLVVDSVKTFELSVFLVFIQFAVFLSLKWMFFIFLKLIISKVFFTVWWTCKKSKNSSVGILIKGMSRHISTLFYYKSGQYKLFALNQCKTVSFGKSTVQNLSSFFFLYTLVLFRDSETCMLHFCSFIFELTSLLCFLWKVLNFLGMFYCAFNLCLIWGSANAL